MTSQVEDWWVRRSAVIENEVAAVQTVIPGNEDLPSTWSGWAA